MNNLKKIREIRNLSRQELADKIKTSRQTIFSIETGKINISSQLLLPLCKALSCTPNDLYDEYLDLNNLKENKKSNMIKLKYYDLSASAGDGCFVDNENLEVMEISEKQLNEMGITFNYQNIRVIRAKGNSMYPTIHDGDLLFVDKEKKEIFNDKIYIINEKGFLKVKRVLIESPFAEEITIKSDNHISGEYPPYNIKIDGCQNVVCGMVVFFCRSL